MRWLSPVSLLWLGLLVPLIALYVLRRRRARTVVPSTLLWEAAVRDLRAERPWQRLRPHLSLILQALALIAAAVALSRPAGAGQIPAGAKVAVIVDVSASMAAEHDGESRLERALDIARSLARGLPEGGTMMIVSAGAQPEVASAATADRVELERALDRLRAGGAGADIESAVSVAAERMRDAPAGSRIVVLTDAANAGNVPLVATVPVEIRRVGEPLVNHAIVALDVRARPTEGAPDRADIYVRVARFGEGQAEVRLTASIHGGRLLSSRTVLVRDGEPSSVVLSADLPPDGDGRASFVEVAIEDEDSDDALDLDDRAVAASPVARRLPVFLVGDAPRSVERVLRSDREVELYATDLEALASRDEDAPALDGMFVFAGVAPQRPPPGDVLVVAPRTEHIFDLALGPLVERPTVVTWADADPRLRFVSFADVHLLRMRPILGASARPLLTTSAGTAIGVHERVDGETTLLAFDPDEGDWSRQPGFVVFVRNLLEHARRRRAAGGIEPGGLGVPLRIPARGVEEVRVTTPAGASLTARTHEGVAVVPVPAEPGVFRAEVGGRELFALRSLTDAEESDLRPRATFTRGDGTSAVATVEAEEHREAWPFLALALLVLLTIEVVYATRRGAT